MNIVGRQAEDRALAWLQQRGLAFIERNWRCRVGEIDLVMKEHKTWVMVEVRYRKNVDFGGAIASLTAAKCRKLLLASRVYCHMKGLDDDCCRIDAVLFDGAATVPLWLKNILA